jgi:hypothetical protein
MCLSCGCGRPHDTHGDSRHITYEDVVAAGQAADLAPGEAASNVASTFRQMTDADDASTTKVRLTARDLNLLQAIKAYDRQG